MAFGANIEHGNHQRILANILKALNAHGTGGMGWEGLLVMKDGAPVTDTAADNPGQAGVFCWDYTNDVVYVCTEWTSATVFDWDLIDCS